MGFEKVKSSGGTKAYLRVFRKNDDTVQTGRVRTLRHGTGLGGKLLKEGTRIVRERMNPQHIYIEAQCHAIRYYEREGFRISSDEFIEDGIPHVRMILEMLT